MTLSTSAVAVCCCERLAQLAEQARVLDGDDGLGSEAGEKRHLLVGEREDFLAVNDDSADQLIVLAHRHGNKRPRAASSGWRTI